MAMNVFVVQGDFLWERDQGSMGAVAKNGATV